MIKKKKVGCFLFRGQPIHFGHLFMIKKALKENDVVLCILGSANKKGMARNPFSLERRKKWLIESLSQDADISLDDIDKIQFLALPDWSNENDKDGLKEWGHYLYYNVVRKIEQKEFSIYYNDDVSIIEAWFNHEVRDYITIRHFERDSVFDGLSATKIRQAILDGNMEYLIKFLPKPVLDEFEELQKYLKFVNENPLEDFNME